MYCSGPSDRTSPVVDADGSRRRPVVGSQDVTARASPFDVADQRSPVVRADTEDITHNCVLVDDNNRPEGSSRRSSPAPADRSRRRARRYRAPISPVSAGYAVAAGFEAHRDMECPGPACRLTSGGDSRCTFWTRFGGHPAAYRALPSMYSVAERDAIPHAGADRPDRGGGSSRRRRTVAMRQAHP